MWPDTVGEHVKWQMRSQELLTRRDKLSSKLAFCSCHRGLERRETHRKAQTSAES